jgi:hypothetical protein
MAGSAKGEGSGEFLLASASGPLDQPRQPANGQRRMKPCRFHRPQKLGFQRPGLGFEVECVNECNNLGG